MKTLRPNSPLRLETQGFSLAQQAGTQTSTDFEQPVQGSTKQTVTFTLAGGAGLQQTGFGAGQQTGAGAGAQAGAQGAGAGSQQEGAGAGFSSPLKQPALAAGVKQAVMSVAAQIRAKDLRNIKDLQNK